MPLYLDPYLYPPRMMRAQSEGIEPPFLSSFTRKRVAPVCGEENEDGIEEGPAAPADGEGSS
jgi:hypothetical protein